MSSSSLSHVEMNGYDHHVLLDCPLEPSMLKTLKLGLKEAVTCESRFGTCLFRFTTFLITIIIIIIP
jgi:hypothetical protein